jgi:predicted nucleic acid-binding protein
MRPLMDSTLQLALELNHSAYDCAYLALALQEEIPFVTAGRRLPGTVAMYRGGTACPEIVSISE